MKRFVDRGAITAAYVGIGMAITVAISFLLVIPIEPIVWLLALPSGLLIGYYANQRSGRGAGPWRRLLGNALFAGLVIDTFGDWLPAVVPPKKMPLTTALFPAVLVTRTRTLPLSRQMV